MKDNSGTLSVNERKEKDTHPDFRGKGVINGQPMWIDAWNKTGQFGEFMSLSFKPREDKPVERKVDPQAPDMDEPAF